MNHPAASDDERDFARVLRQSFAPLPRPDGESRRLYQIGFEAGRASVSGAFPVKDSHRPVIRRIAVAASWLAVVVGAFAAGQWRGNADAVRGVPTMQNAQIAPPTNASDGSSRPGRQVVSTETVSDTGNRPVIAGSNTGWMFSDSIRLASTMQTGHSRLNLSRLDDPQAMLAPRGAVSSKDVRFTSSGQVPRGESVNRPAANLRVVDGLTRVLDFAGRTAD
ncbi:hypothetical protein [Crateriforma conspicua]|uniref:Uncharacterized protein n=1 Tax=Crateriforma conspicua TaxID=2527996 RepID=A0A5C5Y5G6_9PLAN|nr:hypothetical protein [Crateriforma conspicua]QDV65526.1 hypothetical protein Mal65_46970 [Crateriforma conspicua]TWT70917.1 hypothetical protein Pan14r_32250 [Crateriforma conspicua]